MDNGLIELFAKLNLNYAATAQVNATFSKTKCAFSSNQYWTGTNKNLNNVTGYASGDVMDKVNTYVQTKGAISGRLLTYSEANSLRIDYASMIFGYRNTAQTTYERGYLYYWLGTSTSSDASRVLHVGGDYRLYWW
ncbi:MAG: hypothetical protein IJ809_05010 [Clostridia bacterium]|nr:hypothetical protein [Clostridia bacterium]